VNVQNDEAVFGSDGFTGNQGLHLVLRNSQPYMGFFNNDFFATAIIDGTTWTHIVWR